MAGGFLQCRVVRTGQPVRMPKLVGLQASPLAWPWRISVGGTALSSPALFGCRFIDTAGDLELDGIIDPKGKEHLAEVLGHLYQLKLVSLQYPRLTVGHCTARKLQPVMLDGRAVPPGEA